MEFIERALTFKRSTILFGTLGRRPSLMQFYFQSIPDLEPLSDEEPLFRYKSRVLQVWIEPGFETVVFSDPWTLVLTSHLNLHWNPVETRVENCHPVSIQRPFTVTTDVLDLSSSLSTHDAFLTLCNFMDESADCRLLLCPDALFRRLRKILPRLGKSPYISHLLAIFA